MSQALISDHGGMGKIKRDQSLRKKMQMIVFDRRFGEGEAFDLLRKYLDIQ